MFLGRNFLILCEEHLKRCDYALSCGLRRNDIVDIAAFCRTERRALLLQVKRLLFFEESSLVLSLLKLCRV